MEGRKWGTFGSAERSRFSSPFPGGAVRGSCRYGSGAVGLGAGDATAVAVGGTALRRAPPAEPFRRGKHGCVAG